MTPPPPDRPLIRPLHGLRGLAALTVVFGHLAPISGMASLGVVLFFVLSGFLMGRLYLQTPFSAPALAGYAIARIARIYPLFACVVIGAAALNMAVPGADLFELTPGQLWENLALAGSNQTIWTISVECQFYLLLVPLWAIYQRSGQRDAILFGAFALAVAAVLLLGPVEGRGSLPRYLPHFLAGVVLSVLLRSPGGRAGALAGAALPVLLAGYIAAFLALPLRYGSDGIYTDPLPALICAGLVACAVAAPASAPARLLGTRLAVAAGELSFGIYLLHRPADWLVRTLTNGELRMAISFPLTLGLAVLLAALAYTFIETPARRAIRGRAGIERPLARPSG